MQGKFKLFIYYPIILALVLVAGVYVGTELSSTSPYSTQVSSSRNLKFNKIQEIINYIDHEYVDTVNRRQLEDRTIGNMLQDLDPHSYYIPADELQALNEPLQGNFEGIGIEFSIQKDTVVVVHPLAGGPSEELGIRAGDRIIRVDTVPVAGVNVKNNDIMKMLRGKGGTKVKVVIVRRSSKKHLVFEITRGRIPIHSVETALMLNKECGYIKVARFSRNTHQEFVEKSRELLNKGMSALILDLRGNGGGYLDAATKMVDEILIDGKLIVYTEGRSRPRENYYSTSSGMLEDVEVAVLIDEGSASASEIIAGAIQDNDRGYIIGRRSFGKGLVQEQSDWPDGSATRLTIARYYSPTGRCIQKPYKGLGQKYFDDIMDRMMGGELQNADSINFPDSLIYTTPAGKKVYGGGGIMPDVFIAVDTSSRSYYLSDLVYGGLFNAFAFEYSDKNRRAIEGFGGLEKYVAKFEINHQILNDFILFAEGKGIKRDDEGISKSKEFIKNRIKASIARNVWYNDGYYSVIQDFDKTIIKALNVLSDKNTSKVTQYTMVNKP